MEMNTENPFKDCQVLKLNGETTDPTIVYLDDDEMGNAHNASSSDDEGSNPMHVKVTSDFNDDDESNQSMVVEPDDQIVASEVAIKDEHSNDSFRSSKEEEDICLKFEPPTDPIIPTAEEFPYEEQFEVIANQSDGNAPSDNEEDASTSAAVPQDQSFESGGSASGSNSNDHDHSYSQANNNESTSYCDDIINSILAQSNLSNNPKAVNLLSKFANYVEIFTANENPNSQASQFVQKVKDTLHNKEVTLSKVKSLQESTIDEVIIVDSQESTTKDQDQEITLVEKHQELEQGEANTKTAQGISNNQNEAALEETVKDKPPEEEEPAPFRKRLNSVPSMELFTEPEEKWDDSYYENIIKNEPNSEAPVDNAQNSGCDDNQLKAAENCERNNSPEAMEVSIEVVKEELMENEIIVESPQISADEKKVEIKSEDADKLQACIKNAAEVVNEFTTIQDLSNLVYETDEDIKNGRQKLMTSLQSIIKQTCKLMMKVEEVEESEDIKIDEFIDSTMLNLRNVYVNGGVKKEEKRSDVSETSGGETDDEEINKLCNISALKISKGNRDVEKSDVAPVKKLTKKKEKKLKVLSDESDMLSSDDDDINSSQQIKKRDSDKESSSDEEQKMIDKHESNVKNMLLVSTDDDESDESTYATSESSMGELSDEDEKSSVRNKKSKVEPKKDKSDSESEKSEKELEPPTKPKPQTPTKMDTSKNSGDESSSEKVVKPIRPKQRQMDGTTREIFKKDFLDLDDSGDDDTTPEKPKSDKTSLANQMSSPASNTSLTRESTSGSSQTTRSDNDAIDLSQYTARQSEIKSVDLTKYIEKKITEKITANEAAAKPSTPFDDEDCFIISSDSDSEVSSTHEKTRRRKELSPEELKEETKKAQKAEKDRIKKLDKKKEALTEYLSQRLSQQSMDDDIICENDLILDFSKKLNKSIEVHPQLVDKLKEHQKEGIQFMYDNCYGNVDDVKEDNGSGCILAHCMGLGKTLQLIALIHTITRYPELQTKRILVICPKTTIYNWFEEFEKWLANIPSRGMKVNFLEENSKIHEKIKKIEDWYEAKNPSVFLINYESFRSLVNWSGSHKKAKISLPDETVKKYQAKLEKYLLNPGAHLVVCDEGHMMKNQKGAANRAISKVITKRRIILTGTPIQNNLIEYYAMVHWIKPCYLGDIKEFNNLYANPIKEGQLKDSTPYQIKKMKQKCFVLNKMLDKFVQRREASILKEFLPDKFEYCLFVPLTDPQAELYKKFLEANPFEQTLGKHLLPDYTALRKIWTHPRVLQKARDRALRGENKFTPEPQKKVRNPNPALGAEEDEENEIPDDIHDTSQGVTNVTNDWWSSITNDDQLKSLYSSHKLLILFELLKQAQMRGEKVLVFTAFVAVLDVIEEFMHEIHNQDDNPKAMLYGYDQYRTTWQQGRDYLRLDGSTPRDVRHTMINTFNKTEDTRLRCFLISAKAGGQGINLIGANRCVLIDTSWNPSSDQQNIFRIFRLGQRKPCYIYRLVALGTMEEKIYSRSVTKQAMSSRVVDRQIIDRHYRGDELEKLYQFTEYDPKLRETPVMPKDDILKFLLMNYQQQIYKYHEHDSLLENKPEQDLSEVEKKEAWDLYENEQRAQVNRLNPMLANMYPQYGNGALDLGNYANEIMNLNNNLNSILYPPSYNNMMPSTSAGVTGLDYNALNKFNYPPITSSMYTNEFYKKFQQVYDPLNIYGTQSTLPLPPVSTITSSSSSTLPTVSTNSANNIMSSLLRSPLAPPTVPPAHSLSSIPITYNANSIALPTTSMFASKPTSLNSASVSLASTTASTTGTTSKLAIAPNAQAKSLVKPNILATKKNIQNIQKFDQALKIYNPSQASAVAVPKGSSSSLSILPDNDANRNINNGNRNPQNRDFERAIPKSKSSTSIHNNLPSHSSARTNAPPYIRKNSTTVREQLKRSLPQSKKVFMVQNPPAASKPVTIPKPVMTIPKSVMGIPKPVLAAPKLPVVPVSKSPAQSVPFRKVGLQNAQVRARANAEVARRQQQNQRPTAAQPSGIFPNKRTSIDPAIQKQLEKNQTSMTEATKPIQITSVIGRNPENSVSIIALKSNATTSQPRPQKPQNAEIAITPLMTPPSSAKKTVQITPPAKVTLVNRPATQSASGTKVVISPQYFQGAKRSADQSNITPHGPVKRMRPQAPQQLVRHSLSQPQVPTNTVNSRVTNTQQQQTPKRPVPNLPVEIVELE